MARYCVWIPVVVCVLLAPAPGLADDITIQLDTGAGFSIRDAAGAERVRIDELGDTRAGRLILDPDHDAIAEIEIGIDPMLQLTEPVTFGGGKRKILRLPVLHGPQGAPDGISEYNMNVSSGGDSSWNHINNVFQILSYNHLGGTRIDPNEHSFVVSFESDFNSSATTGDESWIENNWSVLTADGLSNWRPFQWVWNADADVSTWSFRNRAENPVLRIGAFGEDAVIVGNSEIIQGSARAALDVRRAGAPQAAGGIHNEVRFSGSMSNPSSTEALEQVLSLTATGDGDVLGDVRLIANQATLDFQDHAGPRASLRGVRTIVEMISEAGGSPVIPQANGHEIGLNFSGLADGASVGRARGIWIQALRNVTSGAQVERVAGIEIGDLGEQDPSPTDNWVLLIRAQDNDAVGSDAGRLGNVTLEGGDWDNGHLMFGSVSGAAADHLWVDQTRDAPRFKGDGAPTGEADGRPVALHGGGLGTSGLLAWASDGTTCTSACSDAKADACAGGHAAAGGEVGCSSSAGLRWCLCN